MNVFEHVSFRQSGMYFEDHYDPHSIHMHRVKMPLVPGEQSEHQFIQIFELEKHGRVLVLDGFPQISERDGWLYTEAMVLPALLMHHNPRNVLILGGGDGAAASFSARDPRVKRITLVDIDERVVELTKQHIPSFWEDALLKEKAGELTLEIFFEDALAFLKQESASYDIIILDITDPNEGKSAAHLLNEEFFASIKEHLGFGGVLAMQSGEYAPDTKTAHEQFLRIVSGHFWHGLTGAVYIPLFSTMWSFTLARHNRSVPDFSDLPYVRMRFKGHARFVSKLRALTAGKLAAMFAIVDEFE